MKVPIRSTMIAAVAFALVACGSNANTGAVSDTPDAPVTTSAASPTSAPAQTIKIGVVIPLTGTTASNGELFQHGLDMAFDDVNSSGALGGSKIEASYADDHDDPATAVSAFNQLVTVKKVPAVVSATSGPVLAVAPIAEKTKTVLVNVGATSPELAGASTYLFNSGPLITDQAVAVLHYAVQEKGLKTFALYYSASDVGKGLAKHFDDIVTKAGGTPVGKISFDTKTTEYRATLSRVQALKPDAVFVSGPGAQTGNIIEQAAGLKFTPTWIGGQGISHEATIKVGAASARGGFYGTASTIDPATNAMYPEAEAFEKAYVAKYGGEHVDDLAYYAYETGHLLGATAAELLKQGKDVSGENLQAALNSLNGFHSVLGPVSFRPDGTPLMPLQIFTDVNDKWQSSKIYTTDEMASW